MHDILGYLICFDVIIFLSSLVGVSVSIDNGSIEIFRKLLIISSVVFFIIVPFLDMGV